MPKEYLPSLSSGVYGSYKINNNNLSEQKKSENDTSSTQIPYGSWTSPLTSESIAGSCINIKYLNLNKSKLYWVESRPTEKGRNVITSIDEQDNKKEDDEDNKRDITPKELNTASGVHEYGGNPYIILKDETYLTCNWDDGKLYIIDKTGETFKECTNEYDSGKWLYCDMTQNPKRPSQIYSVREQHMKNDKPSEVVNCLVCIDIDTKEQNIIASGNTFYSYPRVSPDGSLLAYITWNHPNMPWDNTMLCLATLNSVNGEITANNIIDSGSSIIQPKWSDDGNDLYYITDQRDYWEIWRYNLKLKQARPILEDVEKMEFGWPCWQIGKQRFDLMDDDTIYAAIIQNGSSKLVKITKIKNKKKTKMVFIDLDETQISYIEELFCDKDKKKIYFLAGGPLRATSIFEYDIKNDKKKKIVPKILISSSNTIDPKYISIPQSIEFKTSNNQTGYAYIYEPKNDDIKMMSDDKIKPPLLVLSHGGPTSQCTSVYNENILFFTSRGWTVANVNYRGSTGYGTIYRKLLELNWGIYDKEDCFAVVEYLKSKNKINKNQCAIRGGSAGGYTTLCCLTMDNKKEETFNCGCSRYGVADIGLLLKDTHKFESQYLYPLLGYDQKIYHDRSPINFIKKLKCPVLFEHGDLDKVVPLNQAQVMFEAMKKKKITTGLEIMKDEYHGFKKAESKIKAIDFEYRFYSEILGFKLAKQDEANMKKPNLVYGDKK